MDTNSSWIVFLSIRVSFMSIGVAPQAISSHFSQLPSHTFTRMFTNGHEFSSILFLSIRVSFMMIGVAPQAISSHFPGVPSFHSRWLVSTFLTEKLCRDFCSFYDGEWLWTGKRIGQTERKKRTVFQNGPFRAAKRPILLARMIHSERRNGPFSSAEWAILKAWKM